MVSSAVWYSQPERLLQGNQDGSGYFRPLERVMVRRSRQDVKQRQEAGEKYACPVKA